MMLASERSSSGGRPSDSRGRWPTRCERCDGPIIATRDVHRDGLRGESMACLHCGWERER